MTFLTPDLRDRLLVNGRVPALACSRPRWR